MPNAGRQQAVDDVEAERALWTQYCEINKSRGIDIEVLLLQWSAQEIERLHSPGAKDDFHELCRNGCHPVVLAAIITVFRYSPRLESYWAIAVGPAKARKAVTRALDQAAMALESTFSSIGTDETTATEFKKLGRDSPARIASELRLYGRVIDLPGRLAAETRSRSLTEIAKYVLCGYVKRATGRLHDRNVTGLVAEISQSDGYNEVAHRMWRNRNYSRLGSHFESMVNFLAAMSMVIVRRT